MKYTEIQEIDMLRNENIVFLTQETLRKTWCSIYSAWKDLNRYGSLNEQISATSDLDYRACIINGGF